MFLASMMPAIGAETATLGGGFPTNLDCTVAKRCPALTLSPKFTSMAVTLPLIRMLTSACASGNS